LAKFFISSNTSLKDFRNPYLTHLLNQAGIQNYSSKTFKRTIIPDIMKQVRNGLADKLNRAKSITMITDLWSNKQMIPFLGLAVSCTFENLEQQNYVIGLKRIYGKHNAENIKDLIEEILSEYEFDYSNIVGIITDRGSNLVRLFPAETNVSDDSDDSDDTDEDETDSEDDSDDDSGDENDDDFNNNSNSNNDHTRTAHLINSETNLLPKLNSLDSQVNSIVDVLNLQFSQVEETDEDEHEEKEIYKKTENKSIIQLGDTIGTIFPRYSCCVHKAHNAIKKVIDMSPKFKSDLKSINKWTKSYRLSNPKDKMFEIKPLRLKCHNATRWSSGFLNLHSAYKAHKRDSKFLSNNECPLTFKMIEFYLQLLLPAYRFTIIHQKNTANISEVLPSILLILKHGKSYL